MNYDSKIRVMTLTRGDFINLDSYEYEGMLLFISSNTERFSRERPGFTYTILYHVIVNMTSRDLG